MVLGRRVRIDTRATTVGDWWGVCLPFLPIPLEFSHVAYLSVIALLRLEPASDAHLAIHTHRRVDVSVILSVG